MGVSLNTNAAALAAAYNLSKSVALNQKRLTQLSSGAKIVNPSDDAGGLAVSVRMAAALKRTAATQSNLSNALSFLQTQEASLRSLSQVLNRMSELVTLMKDVTKGPEDLENYVAEMRQMALEMSRIQGEKFNGIALFSLSGSTEFLEVGVSEDGSQVANISQADLGQLVFQNVIAYSDTVANIDPTNTTDGLTLETYTFALETTATLLANNGAEQSRLQAALEAITAQGSNLEAAQSRILDVDVASATTQLAKSNLLMQAGSAMLQQANLSQSIAMKLIVG
jgi:flagellin